MGTCCSKNDSTDHPTINMETGGAAKRRVVVIVDPISSGAPLAAEFVGKTDIIRVDTCAELAGHVNPRFKNIDYKYQVQFDENEAVFEKAVTKVAEDILRYCQQNDVPSPFACIAGCECGVQVAELLAYLLGVPTNDSSCSEVRRDKYLMGERVRDAGLRAVEQKLCSTWEEVSEFVNCTKFDPFEYIIKPINSAGSDNVRRCLNLQELKEGFAAIVGKKNVLGIVEDTCLVQECLKGDEYVVDTVTRHGVHKVVAIWRYDKRPVNGAPFVYFGQRLVSGSSDEAGRLCAYIFKVLDALSITNSAGHNEIRMTATGKPCLIESGARPHGGDGDWIPMVQHCIGYSQVSVLALSFLDFEAFKKLPNLPVLSNCAVEVMLVNRRSGILASTPRWKEVLELPTYHASNTSNMKIGQYLPMTINALGNPATIILLGKTTAEVERDFDAIRKMELDGFYIFKEDEPTDADRRDYQSSPAMQAMIASRTPRFSATPDMTPLSGAVDILRGSPLVLRNLAAQVDPPVWGGL